MTLGNKLSTDLNGVQVYQQLRKNLKLFQGKFIENADDPIIAQAETLIGSTNPTPETCQPQEELNKKLLVKAKYVGSLEEGETAPTVEALPGVSG